MDRILVLERVDDAATYQDFFVVLDKAMFLTLHKVDQRGQGYASPNTRRM